MPYHVPHYGDSREAAFNDALKFLKKNPERHVALFRIGQRWDWTTFKREELIGHFASWVDEYISMPDAVKQSEIPIGE